MLTSSLAVITFLLITRQHIGEAAPKTGPPFAMAASAGRPPPDTVDLDPYPTLSSDRRRHRRREGAYAASAVCTDVE